MKKIVLLLSCFFILVLSSCGRTDYIESGSLSTNKDFITEGRFIELKVNNDFDLNGYNCSDAYYNGDKFFYLIKNDDLNEIKLISYTIDGANFKDLTLDLPYKLNNQRLITNYSNNIEDYTNIENINLFYFDPYFLNDTSIIGYCSINGVCYSDYSPIEYISKDFKVIWNIDGSIDSVEQIYENYEDRYKKFTHQYKSYDDNGNLFTVTNSGVIRSSNGKYLDTYFDFINSSFLYSINSLVYANEDVFSALSSDDYGVYSFSIFKRSDKEIRGVDSIGLYCSSLDDNLKELIISFNNTSKDYRVGVRNYSDLYRDYSIDNFDFNSLNDIAYMHLKEDVLTGDIPDMIYEYSGCDFIFVKNLSDKDYIIDLSEAIHSDKSIKKNVYISNIYDFSDNKPIYTIIPSFTYDTCITTSSYDDIPRNWTLNEYLNYRSLLDPDLIMMDSYSSDIFIHKALEYNGYSWIDINSGEADFGEDYKNYLELAYRLPRSFDDYNNMSMTGQIPVNICVFSVSIGNLARDYLKSWKKFREEPINVGFPTNTESDRVIHPSGALMICSNRVAAPGCWEFARKLLSSDYQNSLNDSIPVLESAYENWKNRTTYEGFSESDIYMFIEGQLYIAPEISSDKADLLSNMILSCDKYYFNNSDIEEIVIRNAKEYFDGNISVDDAAYNTEIEVEEYLKSILPNAS